MAQAQGKIDGFSAPLSYSCRNLAGSTVMMSAAETVTRQGYLWFNEMDHRTHHEEMWDHMSIFTPYTDPAITREIYLRDSAADILRGYGDWWMDLFGRGWFRDADIWRVRAQLEKLDRELLVRPGPFAPEVANVVHEDSFLYDGWHTSRRTVLKRQGFATAGVNYGQYLLSDVLANPPKSVKLFYLTVVTNLDAKTQAQLAAFKASRPDAIFVENVRPEDLAAPSIAAQAQKAGVHCYTPPGKANVCAAEGLLLVQALAAGPLEIDFGMAGSICDYFTGKVLGMGPKLTVDFRLGETRLLQLSSTSRLGPKSRSLEH